MSVAGVVLAAGAGSRMGRPKADVTVSGERLLDRAVDVLRSAGCDPVIAVVRPGTRVDGARAVVNPEPERGMRSSLELALAGAPVGGIAVLLVDTPGIDAAAVRTVVDRWRHGRIAVGTYGGRRAHPVVMPTMLWNAALALAGPDEGARAFMAAHPEYVDEVQVEGDADAAADLDTPAELASWEQRERDRDAPSR